MQYFVLSGSPALGNIPPIGSRWRHDPYLCPMLLGGDPPDEPPLLTALPTTKTSSKKTTAAPENNNLPLPDEIISVAAVDHKKGIKAIHASKWSLSLVEKVLTSPHAIALCKQTQGALFYQKLLGCFNHREVALLYENLRGHIVELSTHATGNYVVQYILKNGASGTKVDVCKQLQTNVGTLILSKAGSHVVECVLDILMSPLHTNDEYMGAYRTSILLHAPFLMSKEWGPYTLLKTIPLVTDVSTLQSLYNVVSSFSPLKGSLSKICKKVTAAIHGKVDEIMGTPSRNMMVAARESSEDLFEKEVDGTHTHVAHEESTTTAVLATAAGENNKKKTTTKRKKSPSGGSCVSNLSMPTPPTAQADDLDAG
eukprot:PhF_6_TR41656/c0_g1_i1/m.63152